MKISKEEKDKIINLFQKPHIMGIIGDRNQAKSMLIYHLIDTLKQEGGQFDLYTYGLEYPLGNEIFSIREIESLENSVIILDEIPQLLELDQRAKKKEIENFLRLLSHRNNCLILSSTAESFKKFLASKLDIFIFKTTTINDAIQGSLVKEAIKNYSGPEKGTHMLSLNKDTAIVHDGFKYYKIEVPYYNQYDSKGNNKPIVSFPDQKSNSNPKNTQKKVNKNGAN